MANKGFWQSIWNNLKGLFTNGSGDYVKHLQDYYSNNPDSYLGWDNVKNIGESYINQYTQAGLTGREKAMMQYQTRERLDAQAFEERMSSTSYQRAVADMQSAGINPALMYGNGASGASTPSSSGQTAPGYSPSSMSDLIQLLTLKPTLRNLNADSKVKEADAKDKLAGARLKDTENEYKKKMIEYQNLVNSRYNDITDANLSAIQKGLQVSDADIDLKRSDKAFKDVQTALEEWKKDHQDEYFELEKSLKGSEIDINRVERSMMELERNFMRKYSMKMGTNEQMALVIGLCSMFGIDLSEKCQQFAEATKSALDKVGTAMNNERGHFFDD